MNNPIQTKIKALVDTMLGLRGSPYTVEPEDELIESGLTSLEVVKLAFQVEAEFEIFFPNEDIRPANFKSIATISALVARLQGLQEMP